MTELELREVVRRRLLSARSMSNVVNSPVFGEAFATSDDAHRREIERLVTCGDHRSLASLVRRVTRQEIGEMSVRQLRAIAQRYGVPYCHLMTKSSLLSAIYNVENANDSNGEATPGGDVGTPPQVEGVKTPVDQA